MTDGYLARNDADFFWLMIVFGVMFVIMLAGVILSRNKDAEERVIFRRRFVWAAIIVLTGYCFISVPFTGHFYRFRESPKVPETIESTDAAWKHTVENSQRIERLEQQVTEAREEMREVRDHYQRLLQFLMTAIFIYGFSQILKKTQAQPDPQSALNLKD